MKWQDRSVLYLQTATQIIALALCILLILSSAYITGVAFFAMFTGQDPAEVIIRALFVMILLELFYVIRAFIKRGSLNVGVIINVGVIAAVKELIFQLDSLTLQMSIAFGVLFLTLGVLYVMEVIHYERKRT